MNDIDKIRAVAHDQGWETRLELDSKGDILTAFVRGPERISVARHPGTDVLVDAVYSDITGTCRHLARQSDPVEDKLDAVLTALRHPPLHVITSEPEEKPEPVCAHAGPGCAATVSYSCDDGRVTHPLGRDLALAIRLRDERHPGRRIRKAVVCMSDEMLEV